VAEGRLSLAATLRRAGHRVVAQAIARPKDARRDNAIARAAAAGRSLLGDCERPDLIAPTGRLLEQRARVPRPVAERSTQAVVR
jgi:hypothetical protein